MTSSNQPIKLKNLAGKVIRVTDFSGNTNGYYVGVVDGDFVFADCLQSASCHFTNEWLSLKQFKRIVVVPHQPHSFNDRQKIVRSAFELEIEKVDVSTTGLQRLTCSVNYFIPIKTVRKPDGSTSHQHARIVYPDLSQLDLTTVKNRND